MQPSLEHIQNFYDEHVTDKLAGFVDGNRRIEQAWATLEKWAPLKPERILEIGCGIGDISWRMSRLWPTSEVIGLDVSPRSLEIATKLFSSDRVSFLEGPLEMNTLTGMFDLIVMMDVYEHVSVAERQSLHAILQTLLTERGRIFLSFPTPRHLAWLRQYQPEHIQPIDENIDLATISTLATNTQTHVLLYQEVGVWHEGDYAHVVLQRGESWIRIPKSASFSASLGRRIQTFLPNSVRLFGSSKHRRLKLVHKRLGRSY